MGLLGKYFENSVGDFAVSSDLLNVGGDKKEFEFPRIGFGGGYIDRIEPCCKLLGR